MWLENSNQEGEVLGGEGGEGTEGEDFALTLSETGVSRRLREQVLSVCCMGID